MGDFDFFYIRLYLDLYTMNGISYHVCDSTLDLMPHYCVNTTLAIMLCLERDDYLENMLILKRWLMDKCKELA